MTASTELRGGLLETRIASDQVAVFTGVLEAGTYWVFADAESPESAGSFTLSAETAPENGGGNDGARIAGDTCGDAVALTGTTGKIEGDTFAAQGRCAAHLRKQRRRPRSLLPRRSRRTSRAFRRASRRRTRSSTSCSCMDAATPLARVTCGHQAEVLEPELIFWW